MTPEQVAEMVGARNVAQVRAYTLAQAGQTMTVDRTAAPLFPDPGEIQTLELVAGARDPVTRGRLFRGAVFLRDANGSPGRGDTSA
jgi:hypothetical protein